MNAPAVLSEAEIFQVCDLVNRRELNPDFAIAHIAKTYFALLERDGQLIHPFREKIQVLLDVPDMDVWMQHNIERIARVDLKYAAASTCAAASVYGHDFARAMQYFELGLVRRREEPEADTIEPERLEQYDDDPAHRDLAYRLCLMAAPTLARCSRAGKPAAVLDLCCGTGLNSDYFAAVCGTVTGVDLSIRSLMASSRRGRYANLLEGDAAEVLPQINEKFDIILSTAGIYFFEQLDWLFENARRLLNPGGILVFNAWPCPDRADYLITLSGNFRYCHSQAYYQRLAEKYNLSQPKLSWHVVYGAMPNWFVVIQA